jgi:hypothetical protein
MRSLKKQVVTGRGILNTLINNLPFEAHIPGYQWCVPGTIIAKRLARGDKGVNLLDAACKSHDLAYLHQKDLAKRHEADKILASVAQQRLKAKDATIGEKTAAWIVNKAMGSKLAIGAGLNNRKKVITRKRKQSKSRNALPKKGARLEKQCNVNDAVPVHYAVLAYVGIPKKTQKKRNHLIKRYKGGNLGDKRSAKSTFHSAVRAAKYVALKHKLKNLKQIAHKSFLATKKYYKGAKNKNATVPRVIELPKKGDFYHY